MSPATKPRTEPTQDREAPEPQHEALLREIAEDARREPERYLADGVVPEGGE